jgi:hypothetical protein
MTAVDASSRWAGQRVALGLIILAATAPFLGKAFHIDDALYLVVARQILAQPLDPYGAEVLWERQPESLFDANFNPPLWNYLMAAVLAVTGEPTPEIQAAGLTEHGTQRFGVETSRAPEVGLHLLQSVFQAAAILAMYCLARRFVRWPLTATALVALSPAMLPGQNVMLEGPTMAFWLWGVWCHIRAIDTDAMRWTWASGALAALGVMTKYTNGLVVILLAVYSIRRRHWRSLAFLAPPVAALALWSLHNWLVYDRAHVLVILSRIQTGERQPVGVQLDESWGRLLATFRAVGAVTALAIPIAAVAAWRRFGGWMLLLLALASAAIGWLGEWDMSMRLAERGQKLLDAAPAHAIAYGSLGALVLLGLPLSSIKSSRRDVGEAHCSADSSEEFLWWIWLGAVLAFGVLATPFLAVRHLLPGVPPLVWLAVRRFDELSADRRTTRLVLGATTLVTTVCGFLVAKADYDFAAWFRHMAVDVGSRAVADGRTRGQTVWFTGHWGWAYYAERAGMKPFVPGRSKLHEGDLLLLPLIQTWDPVPQELHPYLRGQMQTIKPTPRVPRAGVAAVDKLLDWGISSVRSISTEVHYYSGGTLSLPWQFSRKPLDDFAVVGVTREPE